MMRTITSLFFALVLALASSVRAQSPAPIIVQAASPAPVASGTVGPAPATPGSDSMQAAIKLLEEMKAKNDETLKKQQAALEQLEQLGQAAEELRIYAKRG